MSNKRTEVIATNGIGIHDLTTFGKRKQKPIHEQIYEKFQINPDLTPGPSQKPIPREWLPDIVNFTIVKIKENKNIKTTHIQTNEMSVTLFFETEIDCSNFYREFQTYFFQAINSVIEARKENPSHFNRSVTLETTHVHLSLKIQWT